MHENVPAKDSMIGWNRHAPRCSRSPHKISIFKFHAKKLELKRFV